MPLLDYTINTIALTNNIIVIQLSSMSFEIVIVPDDIDVRCTDCTRPAIRSRAFEGALSGMLDKTSTCEGPVVIGDVGYDISRSIQPDLPNRSGGGPLKACRQECPPDADAYQVKIRLSGNAVGERLVIACFDAATDKNIHISEYVAHALGLSRPSV
jgi:hypothetical protein